MGVLGVFMIYIKNTNENVKKLLNEERNIIKMNTRNYELLLEKEKETRSYRHDMNKHFICMKEYLENQDLEAFAHYMNQICEQLENIQNKCYVVGNQVLDAILNYYLPMLTDDIKININGMWTREIAIYRMKAV